ncbi:hypothetical protein QLQ12_42230 [Actinoplanes sp. NEAU-A12]|uniref:Uncharacterized protein n=1 Tax=Actinoplanes sandaracinus TaxID=3045177 RepID=A0ABT6WZQ8_9ACTN|nr:hypothetical protein [Actinoplanes sandaracinus]MDI6105222.1 hypothetical protein [Actinoplanes sandaracinus]
MQPLPRPVPRPTTENDPQDVVNQCLAAALQAHTALGSTTHTVAVTAERYPDVAADLSAAADALTTIRDNLLRWADDLAAHHRL